MITCLFISLNCTMSIFEYYLFFSLLVFFFIWRCEALHRIIKAWIDLNMTVVRKLTLHIAAGPPLSVQFATGLLPCPLKSSKMLPPCRKHASLVSNQFMTDVNRTTKQYDAQIVLPDICFWTFWTDEILSKCYCWVGTSMKYVSTRKHRRVQLS